MSDQAPVVSEEDRELVDLLIDNVSCATQLDHEKGELPNVEEWRINVEPLLARARAEGYERGKGEAIARYHTLLQNIDAWVDLDMPEHPDLRAAVVAALSECPPECASPACEAAG